MTALCPHCGFNTEPDTTTELDGFLLDPVRGRCVYHGQPVALSLMEASFLHTLAKAPGKPIRFDALANRMGSSSELPANTQRVFANRIRRKLREIGAPVPFKPVYGVGFVWDVAA